MFFSFLEGGITYTDDVYGEILQARTNINKFLSAWVYVEVIIPPFYHYHIIKLYAFQVNFERFLLRRHVN